MIKNDEQLSQKVEATFELTLDTVVGHRYEGYDEDGDPIGSAPLTLLDVVVDRVAEVLATQAVKHEGRYGYRSQVQDKVGQMLDEKAEALVADLWQKQVTETDRFGGGHGEPKSLEAWAAARIEEWLRQSADSYGRGQTRLQKAIEAVLDRKLSKQIDEAIAGARDQALTAVTKVAEEHLTKALRDSIAAVGK